MLSSPAPLQDYYRLLQDSVSAALPLSSAGVQHAEVEAQKYLETHGNSYRIHYWETVPYLPLPNTVDPLLFSIENQHLFDAVSAGNDRVLDSVRRLDAIKQELEKIVAAARLQLNRVKDAANGKLRRSLSFSEVYDEDLKSCCFLVMVLLAAGKII